MAKLKFPVSEVKKLVVHAAAAPEHTPSFGQLLDKAYAKPGAKPDKYGLYAGADIDTTKVPAGLFLVKDAGIYLMSNGEPHLPGEATRNYVVYAETYGPDADYDHIRDAAGGDDFAESLPLAMFEQALALAEKHGKKQIIVKLTAKQISIEV